MGRGLSDGKTECAPAIHKRIAAPTQSDYACRQSSSNWQKRWRPRRSRVRGRDGVLSPFLGAGRVAQAADQPFFLSIQNPQFRASLVLPLCAPASHRVFLLGSQLRHCCGLKARIFRLTEQRMAYRPQVRLPSFQVQCDPKSGTQLAHGKLESAFHLPNS
jgi:hypothetical protein